MTHNSLPQRYSQQLAAQSDDVWNQPNVLGPVGPAAPTAPTASPIKRLHKLLRGRYVLALTLAALCAVGGAIVGYKSQKPLYRSAGALEIRPTMGEIGSAPVVIPMYTQYIGTQIAWMQSPRVIQMALSSDQWRALGGDASAQSVNRFTDNLTVRRQPESYNIDVSYIDENPRTASVAVQVVIQAYQQIYDEADGRELRSQIQFVDNERTQLEKDIRLRQDQILALARDHGTPDNVTTFHNAAVTELVRILSQLNEAQIQLAMAESASAPKESQTAEVNPNALAAQDIAQGDANMRAMLNKKQELEFNIQAMLKTLGENHRSVIALKNELQWQQQRIDDYVKQYRQQYGNQLANPQQPIASGLTLAQLRDRVTTLEKMYDSQKATVTALSNTAANIQKLTLEIEQLQQKMDANSKKMDRLKVREAFSGQMRVISYGSDLSTPYKDKRKQAGVMGFVGGGMLPIGILLLLGLLDQRYRYSDEAGEEVPGLTLLGILPDLPDLLSDPEQAAVAAHCVHQIRTMLQIGGYNSDRRVYAITSATPGDGKTSLTLALGLSFAASGSRTLLIDCDVVGGGLTHRLNIRTTEGILEAIAHRSITDYVRPTDVTDLSILPLGNAQPQHASSISPSAMRRIIADAREQYDTVLIDTGPVLGSIEASAVAANADATILVVSRKQQRSLVERVLIHLTQIRAKVAGAVFNRADTRDFDRSVSQMSMRSVSRANTQAAAMRRDGALAPATNGAVRNGLGPIAHAVSQSVESDEVNDQH